MPVGALVRLEQVLLASLKYHLKVQHPTPSPSSPSLHPAAATRHTPGSRLKEGVGKQVMHPYRAVRGLVEAWSRRAAAAAAPGSHAPQGTFAWDTIIDKAGEKVSAWLMTDLAVSRPVASPVLALSVSRLPGAPVCCLHVVGVALQHASRDAETTGKPCYASRGSWRCRVHARAWARTAHARADHSGSRSVAGHGQEYGQGKSPE